jgi:hypothetical protein
MRRIVTFGLIVTLLSASPALAESHGRKSRGATVTKWVLIGAGAGFGIGFFQGMRVYDDAIYAEQKIWRAAWLSALAGAAGGAVVSAARASSARPPDVAARSDAPSARPTWAHLRLEAPPSPTDRLYRGLFAPARFSERAGKQQTAADRAPARSAEYWPAQWIP